MPLPANAQVGAVPNFTFNLTAANAFFVTQDAQSAASRFAKLKSELREMRVMLSWSPTCGRSARFLDARSAQARFRAEAILELASQAGLPFLREYVVGIHLVLYAHSDSEVVVLALKHQRQLAYSVAQ
jgi:hypothetical protein